jgi:hypothetical protein
MGSSEIQEIIKLTLIFATYVCASKFSKLH